MTHTRITLACMIGRKSCGTLALLALLAGAAPLHAEPPAPAPIAALFETRITPAGHGAETHITRWYFWRDADRVEVRDSRGATGERWERDPSGKIFYSRLFHDERAQIEFAPTEFQTSGLTWQKVSSLVDPAAFGARLQRQAQLKIAGHRIARYRGHGEQNRVIVDWRDDIALPQSVITRSADATTVVRLLRSWPAGNAPVAMSDAQALAAYRQIDGADLGDMESDPLVKRVLAHDGHAHTQ